MRYANKISAFRILAIPFFIASIVLYSPARSWLRMVALVIFSLAVLSDALDGLVARLKKEKTQLGPIIDPVADKLLLMSAYIILFICSSSFSIKMPFWVVLVVVSRDTIILLGTFLIFVIRQHVAIMPSAWGKMTTFLQMATVIAVLLGFKYSFYFWRLAALFTIISGIDYIRRGIKLFTFDDINLSVNK
jgi:cardiolipin synthase